MANRLREAVKGTLYPLLETRGFLRIKSKDSKFVFFTKSLPSETHVLFFQWANDGGERFVVNLSKLPASSKPEMLGPYDVDWMARLQPSGRDPRRWWSTRKPVLDAMLSARLTHDPAAVAGVVAAAISEAEAWLENGSVGSHIQLLEGLPPNTSLERTRGR